MNWHSLAQAVIDRRVELGFRTREAFAAETGLSSRLLGDLERARRDNFDRVTLARLEQALEWKAGTARTILTRPAGRSVELEPLQEQLNSLALAASRLGETERRHLGVTVRLLIEWARDRALAEDGRPGNAAFDDGAQLRQRG